jgi:4'-phosphopantetheinyl transferase EntD
MSVEQLAQSIFIQNQGCLNFQGSLNLEQASCTFEVQAYDDTLFHHCKITFPTTLKRAVKKRKAEFLAGRYCAQQALVKLGIYPSTVGIGELRNPLWPAKVKGSISHNTQSAIAVASLDKNILGIGVDIENIIDEEVIEQTKLYVLQPDEMKLLVSQSMTPAELFTIIFSIKESFYKAAFLLVNAYFDFDAVSIINIDSQAQNIQFVLNYSLHEKLVKGMCFTGKYYLTAQGNQYSVMTFVTIPRHINFSNLTN